VSWVVGGGPRAGGPFAPSMHRMTVTTLMQRDGNLVLYTSSNRALWSTGTENNAGASVVMQRDGNLVVYSSSNRRYGRVARTTTPVPRPSCSGTATSSSTRPAARRSGLVGLSPGASTCAESGTEHVSAETFSHVPWASGHSVFALGCLRH
jgi:hypothetical protein